MKNIQTIKTTVESNEYWKPDAAKPSFLEYSVKLHFLIYCELPENKLNL